MKSYRMIIKIKATKQYFPVVQVIMLYKIALTFESVDEFCPVCYDVHVHASLTV